MFPDSVRHEGFDVWLGVCSAGGGHYPGACAVPPVSVHCHLCERDGTVMGCVFWFLLSCSLLVAAMITGFSAASRCYKGRQRDDDSLSVASM